MQAGRPRLVFAARRAPWPLTSGGRIRSHRLLTGLARSFDTTLVCFEHAPGSPDGHTPAAQLRRLLPGIAVATVPGLGPDKRAQQLRSLASRRSWTFGRYRSAAFAAAVRAAAAPGQPCVVHFDDPGAGLHAPVEGAVNVYSAHNVEHHIAAQAARRGSLPRRAFNALEARRIAREERWLWRTTDLTLAVSEDDGAAMRRAGARQVALCPNGTDPAQTGPVPGRSAEEPVRLLFVGSGAYAPYERGLAWMVEEVLPLVRARLPVELDVVGQPPARPIAAEGVRYVGYVPSVDPWYERAHAVVVPVFEGSGTRLKVLEAAARRRPVVSTRLGAAGLPLRPGDHYLRADDALAFASAIAEVGVACASGGDALEPMVAAARQAVEPLLWPAIVGRLADLYLGLLDDAAAV